jgi:CGNR zinc finger/Putative stress-induced transcription regulator
VTEAPSELWLVESFANSVDVDTGKDDLVSLPRFREWLRDHEFAAVARLADAAGLERARRFRTALRAELLRHHDGDGGPSALEAAAGDVGLVARFDADGKVSLGPSGRGVHQLLGQLLAGIVLAEARGTWSRLKLCPADDCAVAFYDQSRNRSRRWCSMAECGNRAKTRSFRARRTGTAPAPPGPG